MQNIHAKFMEKKLGMEDSCTSDVIDIWKDLVVIMKKIPEIRLPRFICETSSDVPTYELHCFSDSSAQAYAAAAFLIVISEFQRSSNLVFCKTRVAPLKEITIPRLELMGVVIGVRIMDFVARRLNIKFKRKFLWSDSKCVLFWIHSRKTMPVFVENRLQEIRSHTNIEFRYVPTSMNPADLPTRGISVDELMESTIWWNGRDWLLVDEQAWPARWADVCGKIMIEECNKDDYAAMVQCVKVSYKDQQPNVKEPLQMLIARYSSLFRLQRVATLVIGFVVRLRRGKYERRNVPNSLQMENTMKILIKFIHKSCFNQEIDDIANHRKTTLVRPLDLFMDNDGILRCHGRLENAKISIRAKFPILLPKHHELTSLLVTNIHKKLCHAGVSQTLARIREEYWIPQGRAQLKKILRKCSICKLHEGRPYATPPIPPLPQLRLIDDIPFTCTGMDHFGPLYLMDSDGKNVQEKVWICLFNVQQ